MTETIQAWPGGPLKEQGGKQWYVCHKCLKPAPEGVTKVKNRWLCFICHPERPGGKKGHLKPKNGRNAPKKTSKSGFNAISDRQKAQSSLFAKQTYPTSQHFL